MKSILDVKEIRPNNLMKIKEKLYEEDISMLRQNKLVRINCPSCNSSRYSILYNKMKFNFVLCDECLTLFVNPRPSEKSLEIFYKSSKSMIFWDRIFKETAQLRKEKIFKPRLKLISDILSNYGKKSCNTMIEVGAGYGWFCEMAKQYSLAERIIAVEPSPMFAKACRSINNIEVIESTIEKYSGKVKADLIVNFELIAHLYDPKRFLESCYKSLRRGGIFVCSTPNFFGLDMQILKDKNDTLVPHTINIFNIYSIRNLFKRIGFKDISVLTPGLMDTSIILEKLKNGEIRKKDHPFFAKLLKSRDNELIGEFQNMIKNSGMSSHMVVSGHK